MIATTTTAPIANSTPQGAAQQAPPVVGTAQCLLDDQALQALAGQAEAKSAPAQSADRAGGHLQHPHPPVGDPQLGMDRAGGDAEGGHRQARHPLDLLQHLRMEGGGGDHDGFLEIGAVERLGLVEDGQHLEHAVPHQALHRHFRARHEGLHQQWLRRARPGGDVDEADPFDRCLQE